MSMDEVKKLMDSAKRMMDHATASQEIKKQKIEELKEKGWISVYANYSIDRSIDNEYDITIDGKLRNEWEVWLYHYFDGDESKYFAGFYDENKRFERIEVFFENKDDATQFKLVWG